MESKKEKLIVGFKVLLVTLILTLTIILYHAFSPLKTKAYSQDDERVFIPFNDGFSLNTFYTPHFVNWDSMAPVENVYHFPHGTGDGIYAYLLYQIPSDNPEILSIFLSYNTQDIGSYENASDYLINNNQYIFECGFYNGYIDTTTDQDVFDKLKSYYLPYKVPALTLQQYELRQYENLNYYLGLPTPFYTDGFAYFVIRVQAGLMTDVYPQFNDDYEPFFLLTDINVWDSNSKYWYDYGYSNGYDDGSNQSTEGAFHDGYIKGIQESSADYGIHDLLFAVFDIPFEVLFNLFSFTLFGTQVWTILASLLTILIVLWVVKRFLT